MSYKAFPVIDAEATGENILRLRKQKGLSVRDVQAWFGFEEPQAIYKWQKGKSLPSVDNLYALSSLLGAPIKDIHNRIFPLPGSRVFPAVRILFSAHFSHWFSPAFGCFGCSSTALRRRQFCSPRENLLPVRATGSCRAKTKQQR